MAYLTELNEDDIKNITFNYKILDFVSFTPIYEGIQNSNYIITTKSRKYIFTIFDDKYVANNLQKFLEFMLFIYKSGFNCPCPINDSRLNLVSNLNNRPSSLVSFLEGKSLCKHRSSHFSFLGQDLAKLHKITLKYPHNIKKRFDKNFYNSNIKDNLNIIENYNLNLINIFKSSFFAYSNLINSSLPSGIIHGDLFPDNVLFNKGNIGGFIDFYYASKDYLISDIAIIIISWCFITKSGNKIELNMNKVKILLSNYNKIRKITFNELSSLSIICKIYCIRFFLTRLLDKNSQKDSKKVLTKDPNEYIHKLLYFNNNTISFEQVINND
ncbi:homoserine kinase [Alphaproteobacteria bacterium]|nr:homoserine kinase [Alphaproteobacteria bacterium]